MNTRPQKDLCLAIDAMGGDGGPEPVVEGAALAVQNGLRAKLVFFGCEAQLGPLVAAHPVLANAQVVHAPDSVKMDDKPAHVLRRGQATSMWHAVEAVKTGQAQAVVSGGNTGALMALSRHQLKMIKGVDRPAITALWPTPRGRSVVLDVGANIEANALQLFQFAVMGEAFFRAFAGVAHPSVGLLNVGAEELKGHATIRTTAKTLRMAVPDMAFKGFIEGNDISNGSVDVVVTDGFSGNIALKSAEGAARLVSQWMGEAVRETWLSKLGGILMRGQLRALKQKIDPSSVNGGVFLGLNGIVVKSHGGADAAGFSSALAIADSLTRHSFIDDVGLRVARAMGHLNAQNSGSADSGPAGCDPASGGVDALSTGTGVAANQVKRAVG